jgi:hypothetical protein
MLLYVNKGTPSAPEYRDIVGRCHIETHGSGSALNVKLVDSFTDILKNLQKYVSATNKVWRERGVFVQRSLRR